jgi:14-3-3 protein epsilon
MTDSNLSLDGLSLSDEGLTLNLNSDSASIQILEHCLIGRVLTDKQIRFAYFKERLSHFWKPGKKVSILQSDNGRYLFQFNHRLDAAKVVDEGPWLFDNFNLVIERIAPGVVPASIPLDHLDIWVQVHQLPFGFIQPKVGQAIGRFLGELKEYDQRNSVHSTFMRLKVRINVTNPLQQNWQVRANEGSYVHILFKYEKLGIFCYLCGLLGHTDKNCPKLFDMDHDDGARGWGENLRPLVNRMGTSATNKYLKDPIPSRSQPVAEFGSNVHAAANYSSTPTATPPAAVNFDGRILAVQKEISAIKSGLPIAQKSAMVRSGKSMLGASTSNGSIESTPPLIGCVSAPHCSVVLGLLAESHNQPHGDDPLCIEAAEQVDSSGELKKRKRIKAASDKPETDNVSLGVGNDTVIGTSLDNGGDVVMSIHDNPMYDETIVTAGPDDQACREL